MVTVTSVILQGGEWMLVTQVFSLVQAVPLPGLIVLEKQPFLVTRQGTTIGDQHCWPSMGQDSLWLLAADRELASY